MKKTTLALAFACLWLSPAQSMSAEPRAFGGPAQGGAPREKIEMGLKLMNFRVTYLNALCGRENSHSAAATWLPSYFFNETIGAKLFVGGFPLVRAKPDGLIPAIDAGAGVSFRHEAWEGDIFGAYERWNAAKPIAGILWFFNVGWYGITSDLSATRKSGLVFGAGNFTGYGGGTRVLRLGLEVRF